MAKVRSKRRTGTNEYIWVKDPSVKNGGYYRRKKAQKQIDLAKKRKRKRTGRALTVGALATTGLFGLSNYATARHIIKNHIEPESKRKARRNSPLFREEVDRLAIERGFKPSDVSQMRRSQSELSNLEQVVEELRERRKRLNKTYRR